MPDFLLAWSAGSCGGFDLPTLWGANRAIADDMTIVFGMYAGNRQLPTRLDPLLDAEFRAIVCEWRPDVAD